MAAKTKKAHAKNKRHHKPKGVSVQAFERVHWPYLPIVLIISLLVGLGVQSGSLQAAVHKPRTKVLDYATSMSLGGLLSTTNDARTSNGVAALQLNNKLDASAQAKANDMAARNYWSHNTPEGNPPWVFVTAQGYSYQKLGENLATGFSSEQATINGWLASPSHRENMLDPTFTEVGFGFANNPNYTAAGGGPMTIMVAHYGRPTVLAAAQAAPPPVVPKASTTPPPAPVAPPAVPVVEPAPPTNKPAAATTANTPDAKQPIATNSPKKGISLSVRTSRAQVAFAKLPAANFATGLTIFGLLATLGLWAGRHLLALRRVWVYSEAFAVHHPLMDVGLLVISGLLFLMSQTAGFIL